MPVTVTETAAREIASIIKQQELDPDAISLRVGVKGGGCSGFSYLLDLTETTKDSDETWNYEYSINGEEEEQDQVKVFDLKIICDPKSYLYLNGTEIDFKDEVMGRGFVFNNPNSKGECGCGESFTV